MLNVSKLETFMDNKAALGDDLALYRAADRLEYLGGEYLQAACACWYRALAVEHRLKGMVGKAVTFELESEMRLDTLR